MVITPPLSRGLIRLIAAGSWKGERREKLVPFRHPDQNVVRSRPLRRRYPLRTPAYPGLYPLSLLLTVTGSGLHAFTGSPHHHHHHHHSRDRVSPTAQSVRRLPTHRSTAAAGASAPPLDPLATAARPTWAAVAAATAGPVTSAAQAPRIGCWIQSPGRAVRFC